jgi:hypothetical protein
MVILQTKEETIEHSQEEQKLGQAIKKVSIELQDLMRKLW